MSSNTGVDTRPTPRAAIQVYQHQLLPLDKPELFKAGSLLFQGCWIDGGSFGLLLPIALASANDVIDHRFQGIR